MKTQFPKTSTRALIALAGAVALAACSANSGPGGSTVLPSVALTATPTSIEPGQSVTLKWTSTATTSCTASGAWTGPQALSNAAGWTAAPLSMAGTYAYGLTCAGPGGSGSSVLNVTVGEVPAPTIDLQLTPAAIQPNSAATLKWSTTHASSCTGSGGAGTWGGSLPTAQSQGMSTGAISTSGDYSYVLSCTGPGGTAAASRMLSVSSGAPPAPPVVSFSANPTQIKPGQSIVLTWSAPQASSCTASGGTGSDGWNGSKALSSSGTIVGPIGVSGSYSYTLDCANAGGSSGQTVTVVVSASATPPVPALEIDVNPAQIAPGGSAFLSWSTSNVSSCTAFGSWSGSQALLGSAVTTGTLAVPGNYSYTLSCTGPGGGATETAMLTVDTPAAITMFTATPNTIQTGHSTTLAWATTGATGCTASNAWAGAEAASSSGLSIGPINTAGTYTYTLVCTGAGGTSAPSSVNVTVTASAPPLPPAASIESFTAIPNTLATGQSTTLAWSTANATSCTATGGTGSDGWSGSVPVASAGLSIGPINTAATYTYTLNCTGAGGASAPSAVNVTVSASPPATPPAAISMFTATPNSIQTGHSTTLAWTTTNATACTASNAWSGAEPASSAGLSVGPINTAGIYTYTLICTGAGGASAPSSVNVAVTASPPPPPPAATIESFTGIPNTIETGQSTTLAWSTANATSCAASGGTGSDGWTGPELVASTGLSVGPINTAGIYTYTLLCTGTGGASAPSSVELTVNAPPPSAPTVTISANNANPAQIQPGQALTLRWSTTNASSCTAGGGTGTDGWSGSEAISSAGLSVGPIATPGIYTYSLSCNGAGGSGHASVTVTVISSLSAECPITEPSTLLLAPSASASSSITGLCIGCAVSNLGNVTNSSTSDFATVSTLLGAAATISIDVKDGTTAYPAGRKTGFLLADPSTLLTVSLLSGITVDTLRNGVVQESVTAAGILALELLSPPDPRKVFLGFTTTKSFDAVRLDVNAGVALLSALDVYGACVTLQ